MEYQTIQIHHKDNYVIVQLDNGKVNAISLALLRDLMHVFEQIEQNNDIKGVILAGRPHAFSAGLDIISVASMSEEQMIEYWERYMGLMKQMITLSKPLVAAITGYAPAGATILALCTDYRVMGRGEKHVMGMHEFKMSLLIPEMLCDVYAYYLGEVQAWKAVQEARLYNSDEALAVGLVDESVEVEMVLERAEKHLKKQIAIYNKVFHKSKLFIRKGLYKIVLESDIKKLAREQVAFAKDPHFAHLVRTFAESLKRR